jgi:hypothetical protein
LPGATPCVAVPRRLAECPAVALFIQCAAELFQGACTPLEWDAVPGRPDPCHLQPGASGPCPSDVVTCIRSFGHPRQSLEAVSADSCRSTEASVGRASLDLATLGPRGNAGALQGSSALIKTAYELLVGFHRSSGLAYLGAAL